MVVNDQDFMPQNSDDQDSSALPGAGNFIARVVSSTAKELGYDKVAEIVVRWPELTGKSLGQVLKKFRAASAAGEPVPQELEEEAHEAILTHPEEAAPLLGLLLAASLEGGMDADSEKEAVLRSYAGVLNMIGRVAVESQSSLALRGFLHSADCISYWRFWKYSNNKDPIFLLSNERLEIQAPLEIFLLDIEPTQDALDELNTLIRRSHDRKLPSDIVDHRKNSEVARVEGVLELEVIVSKLPRDHPAEVDEDALDFPFRFAPRPREFSFQIPEGAPALAELFASLTPALNRLSAHKRGLEETLREVVDKAASDPGFGSNEASVEGDTVSAPRTRSS